MKNCFLFALLSLCLSAVAADVYLRTNQMMIGGEIVDCEIIDGKLVGYKYIAVSNTLIRLRAEIAVLEPEKSPQPIAKPCLELQIAIGAEPRDFRNVKGFDGFMYMAGDWRTPALASSNKVEIFASSDMSRIAVMLAPDGPLYTSTNSGVAWRMIDTPGNHEFPLELDRNGNGWIATAKINSRPSKTPFHTSYPNWYALASAGDGSQLVLSDSASNPFPALSITRRTNGILVSWPNRFANFVLQTSGELSSTNWRDVVGPVEVVGQQNQVLVLPARTNSMFRLRSR